jgi:hypothetical protein
MLAEVVVFPTPPLPEVTTIVSDNSGFSYAKILGLLTSRSLDASFSSRMTVIK